VLGISDPKLEIDAPPGGVGDRCDPLPFDAGRYLYTSSGTGMSWQVARNFCRDHGMDLFAPDLNDPTELSRASNGATDWFWVGNSYDGAAWTNVDDCAPSFSWAQGEPTSHVVGDCMLHVDTGYASFSCGYTTDGGIHLVGALCETPRPTMACRAMQSVYTRPMPANDISHDMATSICAMDGKHIVEINSTAELDKVKTMFPGAVFWVAATWSSQGWQSATSCPQVFVWAVGSPHTMGSDTCLLHDSGGMTQQYCNVASAEVICEGNY
jgi:hypothetical protein